MPIAVVTASESAVNVGATKTTTSSSLSPGTIAGIVIGTLFAGVSFIALALYLLNRYSRHKFTRVANDDTAGADLGYPPSISSKRPRLTTPHSRGPSISSEPFVSPASWPPLPATSWTRFPDAPPRLGPIFPPAAASSFDLGEINQVIGTATASHATRQVRQSSSGSPQQDLGDTPPHTRQTFDDEAINPSVDTRPQQTLFLHRMLESRARASEGVSLARRPSQSRSATLGSSIADVDEEGLLAEAERTALRDAERAQRGGEGEEEEMAEEEEGWEEVESAGSIYSQVSAPFDHSSFFSGLVSRQGTSLSVARRKTSQKQRVSVPPSELHPVAESPDTSRVVEGEAMSRPVSVAASSSLDVRVSHGTASLDQPVPMPLLTSVDFGKDSTASGSISSAAGSSSRASRYPSLAASTIGLSSLPGPRSDTATDWHHPPSGLAGLTSLQVGPLRNPHSPVEERGHPDTLLPAHTPVKHAHLREGTTCSVPEVEKRDVMQGGIACIDVAL